MRLPGRLVLLGHPVSHSLSPRFQNAALVNAGVPATYEALDVEAVDFLDTLAGLRVQRAWGNVTVPHKESVAKLVDQLGSIEDAYAKAGQLSGAKTPEIIRYESPFRLGKLLNLLGKAEASRKVEVDIAGGLAPQLEAGKVYLLPSYMVQ